MKNFFKTMSACSSSSVGTDVASTSASSAAAASSTTNKEKGNGKTKTSTKEEEELMADGNKLIKLQASEESGGQVFKVPKKIAICMLYL